MKKFAEVRFQLEINGKQIAISSMSGFGVLSTIVHWTRRRTAAFDPAKLAHSSPEDFSLEEMRVDFGGLDSNQQPPRHFTLHQADLKVGDTVSIRVLGPGEVDESGD